MRFWSPSFRRPVLVAAVLVGCLTWAMVVVGLSFAMVEHGVSQWWAMPLFGAFVLAMAVLAVSRVGGSPARMSSAPVVAGSTRPAAASVVAGTALPEAASVVTGPARRTFAEPLSSRETEVLRQLASGRSNAEIARALFVAPGTVKAHLHAIFRKLEASSRLEAVAHAREAGLLD